MRHLAYFSTDDVGQALAARFAREYDATLVPSTGREPLSSEGIAARIYDLGHLHPQYQDAILKDLLAGPPPSPVAVHGYDLAEDQVAALRANGVLVSRRLEPGMIRRLCCEATPSPPGPDGRPEPDSEGPPTDPSRLADSVRRLALEAHRALKGAPDCPRNGHPRQVDQLVGEIHDLRRQINQLRRLGTARLDELQRWLDRLGELVEAHRRP